MMMVMMIIKLFCTIDFIMSTSINTLSLMIFFFWVPFFLSAFWLYLFFVCLNVNLIDGAFWSFLCVYVCSFINFIWMVEKPLLHQIMISFFSSFYFSFLVINKMHINWTMEEQRRRRRKKRERQRMLEKPQINRSIDVLTTMDLPIFFLYIGVCVCVCAWKLIILFLSKIFWFAWTNQNCLRIFFSSSSSFPVIFFHFILCRFLLLFFFWSFEVIYGTRSSIEHTHTNTNLLLSCVLFGVKWFHTLYVTDFGDILWWWWWCYLLTLEAPFFGDLRWNELCVCGVDGIFSFIEMENWFIINSPFVILFFSWQIINRHISIRSIDLDLLIIKNDF